MAAVMKPSEANMLSCAKRWPHASVHGKLSTTLVDGAPYPAPGGVYLPVFWQRMLRRNWVSRGNGPSAKTLVPYQDYMFQIIRTRGRSPVPSTPQLIATLPRRPPWPAFLAIQKITPSSPQCALPPERTSLWLCPKFNATLEANRSLANL